MKYLILFILLSCIYPANNPSDSLFFFIPPKDFKTSGYGYNPVLEDKVYARRSLDTLENIQILNLDSGYFRKTFYITTLAHDSTSVINFIAHHADSILLTLRHGLLIKYSGYTFFIHHGFSANPKKVIYNLSYWNLNIPEDKIRTVNYLKDWLPYVNAPTVEAINRSLNYIDTAWRNYPKVNEDLHPGIKDSQRNSDRAN